MLWVKLRVEYGMHFIENRPFPDVTHYIDALIALEPDFSRRFKYADTMLCYHAGDATTDDARKTRAFLERGIRVAPRRPRGVASVRPVPRVHVAVVLEATRRRSTAGAPRCAALQRAVELGDDPDRSIAAANLLDRHGERAAAVRALERAYALTDDEKTREIISFKLAQLHADDVRDRAKEDVGFIEKSWRSRWPFVPRGTALLLGPAPDPLACAGPRGAHDPACAMDWEPALPSKQR